MQHVERERHAAPRLGIGDRGGGLVLERVAHVGRVVAVVGRAREVDRCLEGGTRPGLGVLGVAPVDTEVLRLGERVGAAFARDVVGVVDRDRTVEGIPFLITRGQARRPRTVGIDVAGQGQVEVVADDERIAEVAQVQAACVLFAVGRDQDAAGAVGLVGDEAEGDDQRKGDVFDHGVGRAEHGLLLGFGHHLGRGHLEVVVRMLRVADRVFAARDVDRLVGHHLEFLADELAFLLLGGHVLDLGLAGLEVVVHFVHLVTLAAGVHHGAAGERVGDGIERAFGVDDVQLGIVGHVVGLEFHVLVLGGHVAEIVDDVVLDVLHHGVAGGRECRPVDHPFGLDEHRVSLRGDNRGVGPGKEFRHVCGIRSDDGGYGDRVGRRLGKGRHAPCYQEDQDDQNG